MTGRRARVSRRLIAAGVALTPIACARLFVAPPGRLYRLTPKSTYPESLPHVAAQLLVDLPTAPAGLDTVRIALTRSPVSLDYFADSQWADPAPLLVQAALVASFERSGAIAAIGRESAGLRADFVLQPDIRHFEAEYGPGGGPPNAWVAIGVRLVKMPERTIIARALFEERAPAAENEVPGIVDAFDAALGAVMKQIVVWTLANPALSARRGQLS